MHVAPTIAGGLAGFVLGVAVTLAATGLFSSSSPTPNTATLPPATAVPQAQLYTRVRRIVTRVLGNTYPSGKATRLLLLELEPAGPGIPPPSATDRVRPYSSVYVRFRLNDHPLGGTWRVRAAKSDVFQVLRALYTSQLAVYNVSLDGYFPIKRGGTSKLARVLSAKINYPRASVIPWKRWGRDQEARLWNSLPYHFVSVQFG